MKKHKFSEKLPEVGNTVLCKVLRDNNHYTEYGIFNVFYMDRGLKLEANIDFTAGTVPMVTTINIYHDKEIPSTLDWWLDPMEED